MRLHIDGEGKTVIDGSGDLVITKNDAAMFLGRGMKGLTIKSFIFLGCRKKIRTTLEALKWIWLPVKRKEETT